MNSNERAITVYVQNMPGHWLSDLLVAAFGTMFCRKVSCDSLIMDRINNLLICEYGNKDQAEVFDLRSYIGHKQTRGWVKDVAAAKARYDELRKTAPGAVPGTLTFGTEPPLDGYN